MLPQLGSVVLEAGGQAGDTSPGGRRADDGAVRVLRQGNDGDHRSRRGGDAGPARRHHEGQVRGACLGSVHLALLSTGEDRVKAVIDWTWAGFTHDAPNGSPCVPTVSRASAPVAPSGEQVELVFGDQRAVVVEVGGGLRTYSLDRQDCSTATAVERARYLRSGPAARALAQPPPGRTVRLRRTSPINSADRARTIERDPRFRPLGDLARREREPTAS